MASLKKFNRKRKVEGKAPMHNRDDIGYSDGWELHTTNKVTLAAAKEQRKECAEKILTQLETDEKAINDVLMGPMPG